MDKFKFFVITPLAIIFFIGASCTPISENVSKLPELPADQVQNLKWSETAPILTTNWNHIQPDAIFSQEIVTATDVVATYYIRKYVTQAIYPITICHSPAYYDPDRIPDRFAKSVDTLSVKPVQNVSYHKLLFFREKNLRIPMVCITYGGPWSANIIEKTSCVDVHTNSYTLNIPGLPDPLTLNWYGKLDDMPDIEGLSILDTYQINEAALCCPGFQLCLDGSCVSPIIGCGSIGPLDPVTPHQ